MSQQLTPALFRDPDDDGDEFDDEDEECLGAEASLYPTAIELGWADPATF
jgi:hypothetical protein